MEYSKAQLEAIEHNKGAMMVLAGPGSGKTTVIINRTKNLIEKYKVDPKRILVITFTKAAATQMQERFAQMSEERGVTFGTFHAVFFSVLKHAFKIDYSNIIRDDIKQEIIRELVKKEDIETEDEKELFEDIESEISLVKGEMMNLANYYSKSCPNDKFKKIYYAYNEILEQRRLIDFDDMIVRCYKLFTEYPSILKKWQERYEYILIDEFQDINLLQYKVVQMLAKPQDNIFIVGDDDQSIYRFRGAKPEIMLNFPKDYQDCSIARLDINYRCSKAVVDGAGMVIRNNKKRYDKDIRTDNEYEEEIDIVQFKEIKNECQTLANKVRIYAEKGIDYKDMAVLYRTNSEPRNLVIKLMELNIPFTIRDGLPSIYNHWIAQNMIDYMRAAYSCFGCPKQGKYGTRLIERGVFMKIANKPNRYIGRNALTSTQVDFESLRAFYSDKDWMVERIDELEANLKYIAGADVYSAVNYIRKFIGYDEYIEDYAATKKINLEELQEVLEEFHENCKGIESLDDLMIHIEEYNTELEKNLAKSKEKKNALNLMTFHSAKGLEFKVVFIIDANEGITPHKKSVLEADIEEERRMFYVAMTRAKTYLHIYSLKNRFTKEMQVSRFVGEILIDKERLQKDIVINHKVYGIGKILKRQDNKLTVKFEKVLMSKILDINYCVSNRLISIEKNSRK